jgi:VWFA-related protein
MRRLAAAVALVLTAPLAAQELQPPPIRTTTLAVELDVTVQDRGGALMTDLRREDFEVMEGGVAQTIETVFLIAGRAAPPAFAVVPGAIEPAPINAAVPVIPAERRVFVFFFDNEHIGSPASLDRARKALTEFLGKQFLPGDVGGIVADGRMIGNRLTSDAEELRSAAAAIKPRTGSRNVARELREWPRFRDELEVLKVARSDREATQYVVSRACTEDPDQCLTAESQVREKANRLTQEIRGTAFNTLRSTDALIGGLGRLPGRKIVVFFSDGFVVEERFEALANTVGRSGRTGVRFYTVDTRGLNRSPDMLDMAIADDPSGAPARFDMLGDATNSLAVDTGGIAIRNENNMGRALDTIARDAGTYYVIGYRPANQNLDGKFRRVSVRVKRPGAVVRARAGYLAIAPPVNATTENRHTGALSPAIAAAAPSTLPITSLRTDDLPGIRPVFSPPPKVVERVESLLKQESNAVRLAPSSGEALAREGWALYAKGDVDRARDLLAQAAVDTAPVWVFYALGQSEFALRNFAPAIAAFTRVRQRMPDLRDVYLDLADAYLQSGDVTSSLATMRDAAARWPQDPEFQNAIGVLHVRRNALDEAINAFSTAAQLAPSEPLAYFNLGRAYELRYSRGSRYVASLRQWIAPEGDRKKAAENYQRYLDLGGPYGDQAREALLRLAWAK